MTTDDTLAERARSALPRSCTLEVTYLALERVELPSWTGSLLHGAIGGALRALVCSEACESRHASGSECPYARLFENGVSPDWLSPWLQATRPPMLALLPRPPEHERALERGDRFVFSLRLFGRAMHDVGFLLAALERAAERGIGKGRGRMRLELVDGIGGPIHHHGRVVSAPRPDPAPSTLPLDGAIALRAVTPLRLLREHTLVASPSPIDLVQAAYRRTVTVACHHGTLDVADDLPPSLPIEDSSPAVGSWNAFRVSRYSNRQGRKHFMEGVQGGIELPPATPGIEWLAFAPTLGLGKATAFGFGQVVLETGT